MTTPKIALVTGANKGIGKEIARQLGREGMIVLVGARDEGRGKEAARELADDGVDARPVQLDVTDEASVGAVAELVERDHGRLDVLVNNAAVVAERDGATPEAFLQTFHTNVVGVVNVIRAMLPSLRKAEHARVVNLSSELGSLELLADPNSAFSAIPLYAYNSSKAALNMVTVMFANEVRADGIRVNAVSPGYCATEMNDFQGVLTPAQGASMAVRLATEPDAPTGEFLGQEGRIPW